MRRWLARVVTCLCAATLLLTSGAGARADSGPSSPATPSGTGTSGSGTGSASDRDFTLELRDLFVERSRLTFFERARANSLLARPTQGDQDPAGDGYRQGSAKICSARICVHYATKGKDAPDSTAWVRRTLKVMNRVWRHEVDTLGFRAPPSDRRRGGDSRFDVYLADVGSRGLFGYCTPERRVPGERLAASGYCVLDNDFARRQFAAPPKRSLKVTAAHEFFHAIQFGYDFREDPWLMETTAVWIEESFVDRANDNRRYLRYGNVRRPWISLDTYSNSGYAQYGDWPWWEFLTERFGDGIVRAVWAQADATSGAPDRTSVGALRTVLARRTGDARGSLRDLLTEYAVANLDPADAYDEGQAWPVARVSRRTVVKRAGATGTRRVEVDHLAARHIALRPPTGRHRAPLARTRGWRLSLTLRGAPRGAMAVTVERTDGTRRTRVVTDRRTELTVPFDGAKVTAVVVTAVNGSSRFRCQQGTMWSCGGEPRDDGARFEVDYRVTRSN